MPCVFGTRFSAPISLAETMLANRCLIGDGFESGAPATVEHFPYSAAFTLKKRPSGWGINGQLARLPLASTLEKEREE